MVLSLEAKLSPGWVIWCRASTASPTLSLATLSGAATTGAAAAALAAVAGLAALPVVAGAAAVLGAAGAVAGVAAVLALAGGLAGVGVSCLPHAPSSSTPARVALYNAVVRIERFIGTPVAMTWPVPIHGGCRSVVRMPWSGY